MKKTKKNKGTVSKILSRIKSYRLLLSISIVFAAATVCLTLYVPILVGEAIDRISESGNIDFLGILNLIAEISVISVITALLQWVMNMINNRITYSVIRDLRREAFKKLQILPLKYLDTHPQGEIVSRIIADADQFGDGLLMGFSQLFTGVVTIIATIVFMFTINYKITLIVVLVTPLSLFIARFIAKKTYAMFRLQSETRGEQTSIIDEMVTNQKVVQAFSHEQASLELFDEVNERLETCSLRATFFSSLTNPCTRFLNSLVYASVGLAGALLVVSNELTVGGLSCFLSYANRYTKPFNEISGVLTELQNAVACASRLFELIDEEEQTAESENARILTQAKGNVKLENVSFSYLDDKPLIHNLNLSVKQGKHIAIVGPTGCGKTTLINLLLRFYDVNDGRITVDGFDIRNLTRRSLRTNYGMVLQETWLREGSVRDNIAMGRLDATDEEIVSAAKAAHAHGFIKRLPQGYDTNLGEDGGSLSQGQKQLLCIARVMLCLPPMLILDEATSSIDTRTEVKIQEAFARMMRGRTSFIVAHRLSTIREADMILVMNNGNIVEQGSHEQLLKKGGFYARIYNSQFESAVGKP